MADLRTAETPVVSTVHSPIGNPAGPGLWHHKGLQLPAYIQNVAKAFMRKGVPESEAIERAVGVVKDWAAGRAPGGGHVHPDVQAAAAKAVAEWEAAKAAAHGERFNPYHLGAGPGGGEFTSAGGGGGSGGKAAKSKAPPKRPAAKSAGKPKQAGHSHDKAQRDRLLDEAKQKRAEAHELEQQLKALEHQHAVATKAAAKAAATAKKSAVAAKKAKPGKAAAAGAHHHKRPTVHHQGHHTRRVASLASRISSLKDRIRDLLKQAAALESQAHNLRSAPPRGVTVRNTGRSAGMAHAEARAKYSADQMKSMAAKGQAMKNASGEPSYPIADEEDLGNAIHAVGRGGSSHNAIRKHIISRAKALGLSSRIPDNWNPDGSMSDNGSNGDRSILADEEVREVRITSQYKDLNSRLEIRSDEDGGQWIGGYASVFMPRESRNLGGFIERVAPGAFSEARAGGWQDVVCRFNHDSNYVLGTAAAGTLQLRTDGVGLDYEVLPPVAEERIRELVERGDIRYSSFAFRCRPGGDEWGITDQNFPLRTLHDVELVDVAPVLTPAYPDATAAVRATAPALRSLADHMQIGVDEVRSLADNDELRRLFIRTDRPMYKKETPRLFGPAALAALQARREDPFVGQG